MPPQGMTLGEMVVRTGVDMTGLVQGLQQAGAVLAGAVGQVDQTTRKIDKLGEEGKETGDQLQDMGGKAQKSGRDVGFLGDMAKKAGVMIASYLSVQGAKAVYQIGKMGASSIDTRRGFNAMMDSAEQTGDMLGRLQEASQGTVSEMRLMQAANTAMIGSTGQFGQEMAGALPRMLEWARVSGTLNPALGDTAFLFDSMARGVKRASPLILDNTGLQMRLGEANARMAESLGKAVDELTAEERSLAILRDTLRAIDVAMVQTGGVSDSARGGFERLEAATEDLKVALGERLYPTIIDVVEGLGRLAGVTPPPPDAWAALVTEAEKWRAEMWHAPEAADRFNSRLGELFGTFLAGTISYAELLAMTGKLRQEMQALQRPLTGLAATLEFTYVTTYDLWRAEELAVQSTQHLADNTRFLGGILVEAEGQAMRLGFSVNEVGAASWRAVPAVQELGGAMTVMGSYAELAAARADRFRASVDGLASSMTERFDALLLGYVGDVSNETINAARAAAERWAEENAALFVGLTEFQKELQIRTKEEEIRARLNLESGALDQIKTMRTNAMAEMQSAISSIISAPSMPGDWWQKALPREDEWDEWARRAADVVNLGPGSPWYQKLMDTFPSFRDIMATAEDPKVAAAQWIDMFYKGLIPEERSLEHIIQQYAQMMEEKAGRADFVNRIAAAIGGEGMQVDIPVIQQMVGGPTAGLGAGTELAGSVGQGFATGMGQQQMGISVTKTLKAQIAAQGAALQGVGKDVAGFLTKAFEEAVTDFDFVGTLADAIYPPIHDRLQRAGKLA